MDGGGVLAGVLGKFSCLADSVEQSAQCGRIHPERLTVSPPPRAVYRLVPIKIVDARGFHRKSDIAL